MIIASSALLTFVVASILVSDRGWLAAFGGAMSGWLRHPEVGGGFSTPTRLPAALAVAAAVTLEGWMATRLLLRRSSFDAERWLEVGLTTVLAISILGFGALVCVAIGQLGRAQLLVVYSAIGVVLGIQFLRTPFPRRWRETYAHDRGSRYERWLTGIAALVAVIAFGGTLVHASMSPVIEWDATVYHAETARLWFIERPDPQLRYGPSIGIEISSNYPPLFPAAGAAMYTVIGAFDDVYLRVLPPLLFGAILAMVFGFARRRAGPMAASLSVLLVSASPLMLGYAAWTTGYILLAALVLATIVLVDIAVERQTPAAWAGAGAVAGLAMLSHFYGLLALLAVPASLATHRPRQWKGALIFLVAALAVASPWLLRDLLRLGDPVYPLGTPPFAGRGLDGPLWEVSKQGIRSVTLSYWTGASGPTLTLREFATAVFDRKLLVTGAYFGLWFGLVAWRRVPWASYLAMFLLGFILTLLLQGWYWIRALLPLIPIAALVTATMLSTFVAAAADAWRSRRDLLSTATLATVATAVVLTVIATVALAPSLAVAGPRPNPADPMGSVKQLGSPAESRVWHAFGGDAVLWEWLNRNLAPGERFATLEIRTYYLDQPDAVFYLDGIEAEPLLHRWDPGWIAGFLTEHDVRYVVLPAWAQQPATPTNIQGLMPLFKLLGSSTFPAVAAFPVGLTDSRSVIYSVGPPPVDVRLGLATAAQVQRPPVDQMAATFVAGDSQNRIFVPTPRSAPSVLHFEYDATDGRRFGVSLLAQVGSGALGYLDQAAASPGWRSVSIPLPASRDGVLNLALAVRQADLIVRNMHLEDSQQLFVFPKGGIPQIDGHGFEIDVGAGAELYVPAATSSTRMSFAYSSPASGKLTIFLRRITGRWEVVFEGSLSASDAWQHGAIRFATPLPGFVRLSFRASRSPVTIRSLHIVR